MNSFAPVSVEERGPRHQSHSALRVKRALFPLRDPDPIPAGLRWSVDEAAHPLDVESVRGAPPPPPPIVSKDGPRTRAGCAIITPRGNNTAVVDAAGNVRVFNSPIAGDMTLGLGQQAGVIGPGGISTIAGIQPIAPIGVGIGTNVAVGGTLLGAILAGVILTNNDNDRPPPLSH